MSSDCIIINGEHYTVSNGFVTKAYGEVQIQYNDLLTVEVVKCRSKKLLYAMLIPTGIMILVLNMEGFLSIAIAAFLAIIICVFGILYAFSMRRFIEITSMRGTYRISMKYDDLELENIAVQLQQRIFPKS